MGDPSMTVDGLIAMLSEQYGVELSMLSSGVTILFSDFLDRKKMKVIILPSIISFIIRTCACTVSNFLHIISLRNAEE